MCVCVRAHSFAKYGVPHGCRAAMWETALGLKPGPPSKVCLDAVFTGWCAATVTQAQHCLTCCQPACFHQVRTAKHLCTSLQRTGGGCPTSYPVSICQSIGRSTVPICLPPYPNEYRNLPAIAWLLQGRMMSLVGPSLGPPPVPSVYPCSHLPPDWAATLFKFSHCHCCDSISRQRKMSLSGWCMARAGSSYWPTCGCVRTWHWSATRSTFSFLRRSCGG